MSFPQSLTVLSALALAMAPFNTKAQSAPDAAFLAKGKAVYWTSCVPCHQPHGRGVPGAFPSLVGSDWLPGNPERTIALVLKGINGPMEVLGRNFNNIMTPHEALSDEDIAAVISYVFTDAEFQNKLAPVTPAQVKSVREKFKDRTTMWTAPEILKLYPLQQAAPKPGPKLSGLKYELYLGNWSKMPNFAALKPQNEGTYADNMIRTQFGEMKNHFGVVYTAKLKAPADGEYTFYLASDDGGILHINGKKLIDNDGIHPANDVKEAKIKLKAGEVDFRLEYFQGAGEIALFSAWKGPGFAPTQFTQWAPEGWDPKKGKKKPSAPPIPLLVKDEAVVYRNFIASSGGRPMAVGYPGGFNLTWSVDQFNVGLIWRGLFLDAGQHWTDRGGGETVPTGQDVLRPLGNVQRPFAVLDSPTAPWPKSDKNNRPEGYDWKGYTLDAKRFPTMSYQWGKVAVTERFDVSGDAANGGALTRSLSLKGELPAKGYLRLAEGDIKAEGNSYTVIAGSFDLKGRSFPNSFKINVEGAQLAGRTLLVPVRPEIKVTYSWLYPAAPASNEAPDIE